MLNLYSYTFVSKFIQQHNSMFINVSFNSFVVVDIWTDWSASACVKSLDS